MSASTKPTARFNVRSKSFWLISIFILYSLFGWVFVPMILDAQLKSILKSTAKWDTKIDSILFNPYALSLEINGTDIVEESQNPVVNFERLYINFNLLKTLTGTLSFDEIALDNPNIHVDLDQQGSTNFQRAFATDSTHEEPIPETDTEDNSGPLALFFKVISISDGAIYFTDRSGQTAHELSFTPLSLSLEDFSTEHNQGGDYLLAISLGEEQSLKWQGQIGIAPFQSKGHLALNSIDSGTFWHYVKPFSPYWLNQATVSIEGDYEIETQAKGLQLKIDNTELTVDNISLSESQDTEQWLSLKQVKLTPVSFDLQAAKLDLGRITLDAPELTIVRAEDQSLNILRPLIAKESTETPPASEAENDQADTAKEQPAETASSFKWQLSDILLNKGSIHWHDLAISKPAALSLEKLRISTGAMSQDLSKPTSFDIQFQLNHANQHDQPKANEKAMPQMAQLQGEFSPMPFTLKGKAEVSDIDLTLAQNYLNDTTNILIEHGRINLQSEYDLAMAENLSGSLKSDLRIDQLSVIDTILNKPLSGFDSLVIGPINLRLPANNEAATTIQIDKILLEKLYATVLVAENGQMNLSHLTKAPSTSEEANVANHEQADVSEAEDEGQKVDFALNTFTLKQAEFSYTDASMTPAFSTRISDLGGYIEGISSSADAKSKVDLNGKLDSLGKVAIKGTLNPLSENPNSHIFVQVANVDLTMASPYSAKYAGYLIDKGKLELDLDYLINGSKIKARNEVVLNQFEFGKSVKSEHATSLPLPLAIGILKDRKGVIDLDLPISGDLNDPSFQIGSVILNTFVNIITKVVTSPFSILGGLIEGGDKLSEVRFQANSSELEPGQLQNVLDLSKALKERPQLSLEIRGVADANIDKVDGQPRSEAELITLAKQRAQTLSQLMIEQGNVDAKRVFVQEPEIIPLNKTPAQSAPAAENAEQVSTVTTKFTLGVR